MSRIGAHEKFRWRGWEFRLERVTSTEARWQMHEGKLRIRLVYRAPIQADEHDPELPAEWGAYIVMFGLGDLGGSGISTTSADEALALAEQDIFLKIISAMKLVRALKRGKQADPLILDEPRDSKILSRP